MSVHTLEQFISNIIILLEYGDLEVFRARTKG